jgi:glycogen phosphorylase
MTGAPAGDPLAPYVGRTHIAYFSMEIAIREEMRTYAGGLGILAGDTARSAADLELPMVFVTLASRAGYFRQSLDSEGNQGEEPDWWELEARARRSTPWSPSGSPDARSGSGPG